MPTKKTPKKTAKPSKPSKPAKSVPSAGKKAKPAGKGKAGANLGSAKAIKDSKPPVETKSAKQLRAKENAASTHKAMLQTTASRTNARTQGGDKGGRAGGRK